MVRPSWVRLSSRANGAPLSTASTSPRQASSVAGGKAAAGVGFCGSVIVAKCHAGKGWPTWPANQFNRAIGVPLIFHLSPHAGRGGLTPCQPFDSTCIHALERIADPDARDDAVGGDLGQRHENESALEQLRMGQRQGRVV